MADNTPRAQVVTADGRPHWRAPPQGEAHHPGPAAAGPESSEGQRGQARLQPRQDGVRQGRGDHRAPQQAVRRSLDQPRPVRARSRRSSSSIPADTAQQVPDRAAEPRRRDAHDRDDGSDQRLRDGRHQVHDRLQRRAGRGLGDGGHRGDSAYYPTAARRRRGKRGEPRESSGPSTLELATKGLEELQARSTTPATSRSSRSSRRSAPRRSPSRARKRRSSVWSTSC